MVSSKNHILVNFEGLKIFILQKTEAKIVAALLRTRFYAPIRNQWTLKLRNRSKIEVVGWKLKYFLYPANHGIWTLSVIIINSSDWLQHDDVTTIGQVAWVQCTWETFKYVPRLWFSTDLDGSVLFFFISAKRNSPKWTQMQSTP